MMDTRVYLLKNERDANVYDVAQQKRDGSWNVWGYVHCDFLHDSGLMGQIGQTNYPDRIVVNLFLSKP